MNRTTAFRFAGLVAALAGSAGFPAQGFAQGPQAVPETELSPEYERLFSHEAEHQPLPPPMVTLEVCAQSGVYDDGSLAYTGCVLSRLFMMFSLGVAVTESPFQTEKPAVSVLFPIWLLEIDDVGLYAPLGVLPEGRLFAGGGVSVPVAHRLFVQVEASWVFRDERVRVTAGVDYRIF